MRTTLKKIINHFYCFLSSSTSCTYTHSPVQIQLHKCTSFTFIFNNQLLMNTLIKLLSWLYWLYLGKHTQRFYYTFLLLSVRELFAIVFIVMSNFAFPYLGEKIILNEEVLNARWIITSKSEFCVYTIEDYDFWCFNYMCSFLLKYHLIFCHVCPVSFLIFLALVDF